MDDVPPKPSKAPPDAATDFFRGVAPEDLGIGDAIAAGFRVLLKPIFLVPVLVLSVLITLTVAIALGPLLVPGRPIGTADIEGRLSVIVSSTIVAVIGGLLATVYGQVWLVAATSGPEPSFGQALDVSVRRWLAILGSGLLTGALLVLAVVPAAAFGVLALLLSLPVFVWLFCRLAMATWLAADGRGPVESVSGSWRMTEGQVMRVFGWRFAYGIVFGIVTYVLGIVFEAFVLGVAVVQGIGLAMEFGAGVALYRKVAAAAPRLAAERAA